MVMSILKRLSVTKNVIEKREDASLSDKTIKLEKTWFEDGRLKCEKATGNHLILTSCLEENFQKFIDSNRRDDERQRELKRPYKEKLEKKKSELARKETAKEIKEQESKELTKKIDENNFEIQDVKNSPEKYGLEAARKPRAPFYIGLIILLPITLYLIVFYISASYSAFFKMFEDETTVWAAIFDGQALTKAYNDANGGLLEVIFICTIPFAFMGLGYLIHMLQKGKGSKGAKYLKITALFIVTFIFDCILAYQIDKKIFDFNKLPGEVYDLEIAFQSVGFWAIIFAGFVVYIIWGLVFDFIMKEYESIDEIRNFIAAKKNENKLLRDRINEILGKIKLIVQDITSLNGEISEIQKQIDSFIWEPKQYLLFHTQFYNGWCLTIGEKISLSKEEKSALLNRCASIEKEHLEKNGISNIQID